MFTVVGGGLVRVGGGGRWTGAFMSWTHAQVFFDVPWVMMLTTYCGERKP